MENKYLSIDLGINNLMTCSSNVINSFIINGEFSCCNALVSEIYKKEKIKREVEGENRRSKIPLKTKKSILKEQDNKCIYCGKVLEGYVWDEKRSKFRKIKIHFDHFISWKYSQDNHKDNLYASCDICNNIKSDKYFYNLISAKEYINEQRAKKGY
jgi:5-methylcytosine-specific restriction endonuclease McrA